ncbi:hypothetical protein ACWDA3_04250 [Nonomuraea rubra]
MVMGGVVMGGVVMGGVVMGGVVMATAARRTVVATTLIGLPAAVACAPPRGSAGRSPSPGTVWSAWPSRRDGSAITDLLTVSGMTSRVPPSVVPRSVV